MSLDRRKLMQSVAAGGLAYFGRSVGLAMENGSQFDGGKSQIQSWFLQVGGDYPFINHLKTAQNWGYATNPNKDGAVDPATLDSDGYPRMVRQGGIYTVFFVPSQKSRPGNYVVTWEGNATILLGINNTPVSGSLHGINGSGRYVFSTMDSRFVVGIYSLNGSFVKNLQVFHSDDEAALNQGQIFGTRFLFLLREAKPGVIRFLDWADANKSGVSSWVTRKPISYFSYSASEFRQGSGSYYLGVTRHTANSGTDYAISGNGLGVPTSGGPTNRETIQLRFDVTNIAPSSSVTFSAGSASIIWSNGAHGLRPGDPISFRFSSYAPGFVNLPINAANIFYVSATGLTSNQFQLAQTPDGAPLVCQYLGGGSQTAFRLPTLSLNGTKATAIKNQSGDVITNGAIDGRSFATLVYDQILSCWLMFGGTRDNSAGINNGVPPEICLALCVKIGAHPYFVAPYLACDPGLDWHTQLASYLKNNGPGWMIPRFEGPNETWNFFSGFFVTAFAWNQSSILWGVTQHVHEWYNRALSIMGQDVANVYGATNKGKRYHILCGVQSATFSSVSASNQRLMNSQADGYIAVNINNGKHPAITTSSGAPHGLSVGDPVSFYSNGNSMPGGMLDFKKYYVCNDEKFSATGFDITTTVGGGIAGQITTSSAGIGAFFLYKAARSEAYNWATHVCVTTYLNPTTQNKIAEFKDALNYAIAYKGNLTLQLALVTAYTSNNDVSTIPVSYSAWQAWGAGMPVPVDRLTSYEGGWSPDYAFGWQVASSAISGATQANPCVLTLTTSSLFGNGPQPGNPAVVGAYLKISEVVGMTQLNGNTYQIVSVSGSQVAIDADSTNFTAYVSGGTAAYFGDERATVTSSTLVNNYRAASKKVASLQSITYTNYKNFNATKNAEFPSCYMMAGAGQVWAVWDPDIFAATPPPQWLGIVQFNKS